MEQEDQVTVDPQFVIEALQRKLGQAIEETVKLEAFANQQAQQLAMFSQLVEQLRAEKEQAKQETPADTESNGSAPLVPVGKE